MKVRDECGVIGVCAPEAGSLAVLGLHALQHRGQESAGVATFDGTVHLHKAMGLVSLVFEGALPLPGSIAVGHNRYSTCGTSSPVNAGPFLVETADGPLVLAHNGNVLNAPFLRTLLQREFERTPVSDSDSELLALLLAVAPGDTWEARLNWMAALVRGSYALVIGGLGTAGFDNRLLGVRDPMGNRPLALGRLAGGWALASESCAFSLLGGCYVRDLQPGEIVSIDDSGPVSEGRLPQAPHAFCAFEYIYIARPDTLFAGRPVHAVRRAIGGKLGNEHPVEADLVIGVPDSGTSAALGYAHATGIPFGEGLIKNRYVGRTFIQPAQAERERLIRMKFGTLPLHDKRIVLVDDSIVRGNTMRPIVTLLREAGAAEIHVRVAAPPITDPCYLGVDMASREELIANRLDEEALSRYVGADSLHFISVEGLLEAIGGSRENHCLACFTGRYPARIEETLRADRAVSLPGAAAMSAVGRGDPGDRPRPLAILTDRIEVAARGDGS
ncbi:MAG: amidophosphoribosyltransferase [Chloroflexota bacterium]|nr:amidophosphoribosyltransferase [Chloroflexota bacterium]